jgi:O-antigen ligase
LFCLPIPLGANIVWAWSLFALTIFSLSVCVVVQNRRIEKVGVSSYTSAIYLWFPFIFICALQIIPLPSMLVALLSPSSFELFLSVAADRYFLSVDPAQSALSFIKTLSFFCLFICVLALVKSERQIRFLLFTLMIAGTLQALYGSIEVLLGSNYSLVFDLPVTTIATGTFQYENHYSNFLMLSLAAAIGLVVSSFEKSAASASSDKHQNIMDKLLYSKTLTRLCISIMIIGLVMSRSKMGNAAFFVGIAIVAAIAYVLIKNRSKGITMLLVSAFIINLFIVSAYFGIGRVNERLQQSSTTQETRNYIVSDSYPMIADFPLFGSGAGSFNSTFPSYHKSETSINYHHLQNDYLQFIIEYGVVGSFMLLALVLLCVYKSMRAMLRRRNSIFKGAAFACLMAFFGMGMHMFVNFPLQSYANTSYFIVFLALSMIINSLKLNKATKHSSTV